MSEVNQINAIKHLVEVNQYFQLNWSVYTNLGFTTAITIIIIITVIPVILNITHH